MNDEELLDRIVCNPNVMVGKPVIRGTRLTVGFILNLLGHGATPDEIMREYSSLKKDDIQACQLFAARSLADMAFMPLAETA